jgi:rhodanese-related sulfurtransferase
MFGWLKRKQAGTDMAPADVLAELQAGTIALVDVREPPEFQAERIPGAINLPLSQFDPMRLPQGKPVVLHCLSGGRSRRALDQCTGRRADVIGHVAGGITAWKQSGLAVTR